MKRITKEKRYQRTNNQGTYTFLFPKKNYELPRSLNWSVF